LEASTKATITPPSATLLVSSHAINNHSDAPIAVAKATGSKANDRHSDEAGRSPLEIIHTGWFESQIPNVPTTIDPRMVQLSGPALASESYQDLAPLPHDQQSALSALTEFYSELESEDLNSGPEAAEPTVDDGKSGMQKLRALNGGSKNDREQDEDEGEGEEDEEEREEDELKQDESGSSRKKTPASKMLSKPSDKVQAGKAKSKAGKAKAPVKEEERFPYAPDREPDISNVRIIYVPDDSDDDLARKVVGKLYKTGVPTELYPIDPLAEPFAFTYRASAKTVSLLFRNSNTF
jgi:hypothetical protein